jgi:hypothetical protein
MVPLTLAFCPLAICGGFGVAATERHAASVRHNTAHTTVIFDFLFPKSM